MRIGKRDGQTICSPEIDYSTYDSATTRTTLVLSACMYARDVSATVGGRPDGRGGHRMIINGRTDRDDGPVATFLIDYAPTVEILRAR